MCEAIAREGHAVTLFVPHMRDRDTPTSDVFAFYGVEPSFRIKRYWHPTVLGRSFGFVIYALISAQAAYRTPRDLVYGRFLPACWLTALLRIPTVFEAHVPPSTQRPGWLVNLIFRFWMRAKGNRGVVAISRALAERLQADFGCKELIIAPDAADPVVLTGKADSQTRDHGRLQIGYVGQLYHGKGMELIAQIASRCPSMQFHIAGGSEEDIAHWRGVLKDQDNVMFHGYVPHEETERLRQRCDVLIAPYQDDVRVFAGGNNVAPWMSPLKLFEYMASGKAIVSSDLPALREFLTHQETALLCDPLKPEEWENALKRLEADIDLRTNLGRTAKRVHETSYTWAARVKEIFKHLETQIKPI